MTEHTGGVRTPAEIIADLLRADAGRPRLTFYDEAEDERIELSAAALFNWVAKAANLLVEECDAEPGTGIGLRLPDGHWRTLYWALAIWSTGATVDLAPGQQGTTETVISADPDEPADRLVLVTLPALVRAHPGPVPPGALDEAAELSGYPDALPPLDRPAADDIALRTADQQVRYGDLVPTAPDGARVHVTGTGAAFLRRCLAVWAGDGSVVLVNGADPETLARRLAEERVPPAATP